MNGARTQVLFQRRNEIFGDNYYKKKGLTPPLYTKNLVSGAPRTDAMLARVPNGYEKKKVKLSDRNNMKN